MKSVFFKPFKADLPIETKISRLKEDLTDKINQIESKISNSVMPEIVRINQNLEHIDYEEIKSYGLQLANNDKKLQDFINVSCYF